MIILFWVCLLILMYTFVGYPVLLQTLRILSKPSIIASGNYESPVSVVMVVCNEQAVVLNKINNIFDQEYSSDMTKLIIVDDASDDGTLDIIESYGEHPITLIKNTERQGKAAGLNKAMECVDTELVLFLDARQRITLNSLKDLSAWFVDRKDTIAVSGEVKFRSETGDTGGMDAYQRYERNIRYNESCILSVPGVSGAIYMLRTSCFQAIEKDTILDDVLIPMRGSEHGGWVGFDERVIAWDVPSDDWDREKRRKTRTLNGNYQLLFRNFHWCFPGGHPFWFQFLSHKVLRLTAPVFALLMIASSFSLGVDGSRAAFVFGTITVLGILLYPLSLYFPLINKFILFRIGTSFIALNWFNLVGLFQYLFSDKRQSWK